MSIGTTLNNQTILLAASIVGFIAVPLALWLVVTLLQLVGRVLGFHFRIPGLVLVVAAIAGLVGGSLLIDSSGVLGPAQVIDKKETVYIHPDGSWEQRLSLQVRYSPAGDPIPRFTTTTAALLDATGVHSTFELATLAPAAADFDRLRPGDSLEVRISRVGTLFSIVRPANQTTRTLVPPNILEDALAIGVLICLAYLLRKTLLGKVVLAGVIVIACSVPLLLADQNWQRNSDLSGATEHANATVGQVTRVSEVEFGDDNEGTQSVPLSQPYDVVELSFVPTGYTDSITAVDAVDAKGGDLPSVTLGSSVEVVYPPGSPREARMVGQTRDHYLKTTVSVYERNAIYIGLVVVFAIIATVFGRMFRTGTTRRRVPRR